MHLLNFIGISNAFAFAFLYKLYIYFLMKPELMFQKVIHSITAQYETNVPGLQK